jgi:hypothetical protein
MKKDGPALGEGDHHRSQRDRDPHDPGQQEDQDHHPKNPSFKGPARQIKILLISDFELRIAAFFDPIPRRF